MGWESALSAGAAGLGDLPMAEKLTVSTTRCDLVHITWG